MDLSNHDFYRFLEDLVCFLRCFWSTLCCIFEIGEIVKISVSCTRELDFQGLAGSVFLYFFLFFGVWFLDGFEDGFLVILGWILGAFWLPKSIKNVIDFGIDF